MKKKLKSLLAMTLTVALLAGCGAQEPTPPVEAPTNTPQETQDTPVSEKSATVQVGDKEVALQVTFPAYIDGFITVAPTEEIEGIGTVLFTYTNGDQVANLARVMVMPTEIYKAMDVSKEPVPTELFTEGDLTVALHGLQSQPFEAETEDAKVVDRYQADLKIVTDSMKLIAVE